MRPLFDTYNMLIKCKIFMSYRFFLDIIGIIIIGDDMSLFLIFVFIFFIGSTFGWILELVFRRLYHGKWVNPGFLIGPYLPIYGLSLTLMTGMHVYFEHFNLEPIYQYILMGLSITLIELVGGLIFLKQGVRLWDYRDRKFNFKGVICPLFTIIWILMGAVYYYFIAERVFNAITWFSNNLSFSYILGIFTGCIVIDFCYSTKLYKKVKKYAKNNDIDIIYEKLKEHIKEAQKETREKYSFLFPFRHVHKLNDYVNSYKDKNKRR